MILVTGGAGFIGANFVLDWVAQGTEGVINVDKLTYAGNLENLSSLQGKGQHIFVHGDIGDSALLHRLLAEHQPRAIIILPPSPTLIALSTARKILSRPISSAPSVCWKPLVPTGLLWLLSKNPHSAFFMFPPTKCMAH